MRARIFLAVLATILGAGSAHATSSAQVAYVERRGLLEADTQCRLFTPDVRAALLAGAGQARGALLRGGWTRTQFDELERAAVNAARQRPCNDPRTIQAATQARAGFASWSRTPTMEFPGWERAWSARRYADPQGWRLTQTVDAVTRFGVREVSGAQKLTLVIGITPGAATPGAAQLAMRDPARANGALLDLRGRTTTGLAAGAPSPATAQSFLASARRVETIDRTHALLVFEFPDAAFQAMQQLDPREAIEVRLQQGNQTQRLLVEVGDIAAARTFLTLRPN